MLRQVAASVGEKIGVDSWFDADEMIVVVEGVTQEEVENPEKLEAIVEGHDVDVDVMSDADGTNTVTIHF